MPQLRIQLFSAAAVVLVGSFGCSSEKPPVPASSSAAPSVPLPAPRPPVAGSSLCPSDGTWTPCALLDRLVKAGMVVRDSPDSTLPSPSWLSVPGNRYRIGSSASMVAFFYPDSIALKQDAEGLDMKRLRPANDTGSVWTSEPYVIRSANLLIGLFDVSATQQERIELAVTAGPPQPSTERPVTLPPIKNGR